MLSVGFARLDITPPFGIFMQGYYSERRASGIRDPLYVNAVAFSDQQIHVQRDSDMAGKCHFCHAGQQAAIAAVVVGQNFSF